MIFLNWLNYWFGVLRPGKKKFTDEEIEYFVGDDFIDIKNFHAMARGTVEHKRYLSMLRQRERWYLRNGLYDLAEDISTALWSDKEYNK